MTELSKEETREVKKMLSLNKRMTWPEAEQIVLERYAKQKRLL